MNLSGLQKAVIKLGLSTDSLSLSKTSEAPADGKQYARKDNTWVEITAGVSLPVDPGADKFLKWNDTTNQLEWDDAGGSFSGDMDDIPDGTTYVKTENNLTDALVSTIGSALQSETSHADVLVDGDIGVTVAAALGADDNYVTDTEKTNIGNLDSAAYEPISAFAPALGVNDNYVTDAEKTVIGNTSGTNTGDNATNTQYSGLAASKQDTLVSGTNIKTINSTSLLGSGDITVTASFPRGHIWGLILSNALDSVNDITIQAGEACNESSSANLVLASAITKQIDASWAVGTNAGGMNTGSVADDTWYEVHLIKRTDTGVVDVMFTTTANRATLPANYGQQRRIGWIRRGTATNLQFSQRDDHFTWVTQINDVAANKTVTATAVTLTVPPNSIARFRATADMSTSVNANSVIVFSEIAEGNVTPAVATGIGSLGYWDLATGVSAGHFELRVDSSSQIEHDSSVAVGAFDISTFGYIDTRNRLQN